VLNHAGEYERCRRRYDDPQPQMDVPARWNVQPLCFRVNWHQPRLQLSELSAQFCDLLLWGRGGFRHLLVCRAFFLELSQMFLQLREVF